MTWTQGDFTGDGKVDVNDLTIVLANYNKTFEASLAAVPEPAGAALLLAAALSPRSPMFAAAPVGRA